MDLKKQTLLVIAPHPDDEVLGCGGLIKRIKDAGGKVYVLFLTVGTTKDYSNKGVSTRNERIKEIERVAKYLKINGWRVAFTGDDFHLKLDAIPQKDVIHQIEHGEKISLEATHPTIVATTKLSDYNQDHRVCANAVFAATRPAPEHMKPLARIVIGYESVPTADWATNPSAMPNFFIELTDSDIEAKVHAMGLYQSQIRTGSHPRAFQSIRNHAYVRGVLCGVKAAEAYFNYRMLI